MLLSAFILESAGRNRGRLRGLIIAGLFCILNTGLHEVESM